MDWPRTALTELLGIRFPIVQAPMANGPSTPELAAAVSEAGALGSIAGAALAPEALRAEIRAVRSLTGRPFAVNLFAPLPPAAPAPGAVEAVHAFLAPHRERLGLPVPAPPPARAWGFDDQLGVVLDEEVPVLSFTFGIPPLAAVRDAVVLGTATTPEEAVELESAGIDVVVAQGAEAGGHRGTFIGSFEAGLVGSAVLVPQIVAAVSVPVLAAGGIVDGLGIAAALALGAEGVQLGTAFLYAEESGASRAWRQALRELPTTVSRHYSGRPGRAARTPFLTALEAIEPVPFPLNGALLADLRDHDGYGFYLGGEGAPLARELPAAELVATLAAEAEAALR